MSKLIDLTNKKFGYWIVISRAENNKNGAARWLCKCTACGTKKSCLRKSFKRWQQHKLRLYTQRKNAPREYQRRNWKNIWFFIRK